MCEFVNITCLSIADFSLVCVVIIANITDAASLISSLVLVVKRLRRNGRRDVYLDAIFSGTHPTMSRKQVRDIISENIHASFIIFH